MGKNINDLLFEIERIGMKLLTIKLSMKKIVIFLFSGIAMTACSFLSSRQFEEMNESGSLEVELGKDFSMYAQLDSTFMIRAKHLG